MNFNEYQRKCLETWIGDNTLIRCVLGLFGETGELAEKVKKYLRGDYDKKELIKKAQLELGDVLYYLAVLSYELNIELEKVAVDNINKLTSRKNRDKIKGEGDER